MNLLICLLLSAAQFGPGAERASSAAIVAEPVRIVLFSDFQCPFCAQVARPFSELRSRGVDGVQTVVEFKHFPLSIHPAADLAHLAALAAREQGKFWEMHDLLFAKQSAVKRDDLLKYAATLGLDLDRFKEDLDSDRLKQEIVADEAEGRKLGVRGTPTFFVNGKEHSGILSFDQLKEIVRGEQTRMQILSEVTDGLLSYGSADAPVTLELFADLQSSVTRPAVEVLGQIVRRYPSKARIQFRNFPLTFHPQAPLAHEAAMTAASQGRFWDFAQYILDHQDSLGEQELIVYAGRLGLNQDKFAETIAQHRYAPKVNADLARGAKLGLRGSPVILVNGKRIDGVPNADTLAQYVEAELRVDSTKQTRKPQP
jgi:protein-disulfide isomerase